MPEDLFETLSEVWEAVRVRGSGSVRWNFDEGYINFEVRASETQERTAVVRVEVWNFLEGDPWDSEIFQDHLKRIARELAGKYRIPEREVLEIGERILDSEIGFMVDDTVERVAQETLRDHGFKVTSEGITYPGYTQAFPVWWRIRGTGDTEWIYMYAEGHVTEEIDLLELALLALKLFEIAGDIAMKARGLLLEELERRLEEALRRRT